MALEGRRVRLNGRAGVGSLCGTIAPPKRRLGRGYRAPFRVGFRAWRVRLALAGLVYGFFWWPASASPRRPVVNPVRAGRQQRQRRCRVPEFRLMRAISSIWLRLPVAISAERALLVQHTTQRRDFGWRREECRRSAFSLGKRFGIYGTGAHLAP